MDSTLTLLDSPRGTAAPVAVLVALLAASVGAVAWAAVSYFTGYEVGYVAWGLGALVGFATVKFGGRGVPLASAAAVLTVAGIFGGKVLGTHLLVEKELEQTWTASYTPELHRALLRDADDLAALGEPAGDEELRRFVFEHGYTLADAPAGVTDEELQAFRSFNVAGLRELHSSRPSFEAWFEQSAAESRRAFDQEFSLVAANLEGLNAMDLLFVLLGVSTAFGFVRRAGVEDGGPVRDGPVADDDDQELRRAA